MMYDVKKIIEENRCRQGGVRDEYDPRSGKRACGERRLVKVKWEKRGVWLPTAMVASPEYKAMRSEADYLRLRCRYDFEFWAVSCVTIRHKLSGRQVPFVLNGPQRRVLSVIEAERVAGRPLRLILLKARQWGGSTLIQMYFAWIQCVLRRSWHSLICAQVKSTAATIRGMYSRMLTAYPAEFWTEETKAEFRRYEGMSNTREIAGRDCRVTLASSFGQESVRGLDCSMAHLTEVAFWKDTERLSPEDFVRAVCGGIPLVPLSFVAVESTANGMGNFFHAEWQRAKAGESVMKPVFVAWHEIEIYRMDVTDPEGLMASMDEYEWGLWHRGCTLEQIAWYHSKRREMSSHTAMKAEYPTDDVEAFTATGAGVFAVEDVERLRRGCFECEAERGDVSGDAVTGADALRNVRFVASGDGALEVWSRPAAVSGRDRYVVAVDVGGRSAGSDWSVITVLDRMSKPLPSIAAQWRGHCDHDLLGWKSAAIARWYGNALLVVESNTLESGMEGSSRYILEELNGVYPNLYARRVRDSSRPTMERRLGFHTNYATKAAAVSTLIAAVRDGRYVERSQEACNEMAVYEQRQNGSFGAKPGYHDDVVMTRAIALYVASELGVPVDDGATAGTFLSMPSW